MLAYASHRRAGRRLSPGALSLIIGGHALAIALLVTARIDVSVSPEKPDTDLINIPLPPPPPEPLPKPIERSETPIPPAPDSFVDQSPPLVQTPTPSSTLEVGPAMSSSAPDIGPALDSPLQPLPRAEPLPLPADPIRVGPRAATPADLLRPPYPDSKRRSDEEAVLRLRLGIDQRGRVTSVEPLGAADPAFLAAARSHLLRHWRYRPATEDGRPVASTLTITLRFELEDE